TVAACSSSPASPVHVTEREINALIDSYLAALETGDVEAAGQHFDLTGVICHADGPCPPPQIVVGILDGADPGNVSRIIVADRQVVVSDTEASVSGMYVLHQIDGRIYNAPIDFHLVKKNGEWKIKNVTLR